MSEVAIKISNVSKEFKIGVTAVGSLRQTLSNLFSKNEKKESFLALSNVSLDIYKGQALGIIGKNGAGKSTLLKILSKITYPTNGKIELYGRVTSLLEVGTGFHPELTGSENIYLNGSLLGMTKIEIQSKFDEIVEFAGVEKFINTPLKHYSSGMQTRLAFAVAAHLDSEILLVDEVLAVGDFEFRKKCLEKMDSLSQFSKRTVLFVSHNLSALEGLCETSILLDKGEIIYKGATKEVIKRYKSNMDDYSKKAILSDYRQSHRSQEVLISKIERMNDIVNVKFDEDVVFDIEISSKGSYRNLLVEFHIYTENMEKVLEIYSWDAPAKINIENESKKFRFNFGTTNLNPGQYYADIKLKNAIGASAIDYLEMYPLFDISIVSNNAPRVKADRGGYLTLIPKVSKV